MKIKLITIGTRLPTWVDTAYDDYQKRLPAELPLELIEIPMPKRQKNANIDQLMKKEAELITKHIGKNDIVIALDERGESWSTKDLAKNLDHWMHSGQSICLLVGGPDGLAPECKQLASKQWSLSKLTLSHWFIRPLLAEQFYRAWSIMNNHPYHRD